MRILKTKVLFPDVWWDRCEHSCNELWMGLVKDKINKKWGLIWMLSRTLLGCNLHLVSKKKATIICKQNLHPFSCHNCFVSDGTYDPSNFSNYKIPLPLYSIHSYEFYNFCRPSRRMHYCQLTLLVSHHHVQCSHLLHHCHCYH